MFFGGFSWNAMKIPKVSLVNSMKNVSVSKNYNDLEYEALISVSGAPARLPYRYHGT